mmetsp:Transcript_23976/g.58223  ORF Transcript_23976/g.58223 Transcript_23976/m.58223 type:complete len:382 (-) Transcript_23976:3935-5080(-)
MSAMRLTAMCLRFLLTMVMRWLSFLLIALILRLSWVILLCSLCTSRLCFPLACRSDLRTPVTRRLSFATVLLSAPHTRTILVLIMCLMRHVSLATVRVTFLPTRLVACRTSLLSRLRMAWARSLANFLWRCSRLTSDCRRLRRPESDPLVRVESPPTALRTPATSLRPLARSLVTFCRSWLTLLRRLLFFLSTEVRSRSILFERRCAAATASAEAPDSCCDTVPLRPVWAAATSCSILALSEAMSARRCFVTSFSSLCTLRSSLFIVFLSCVDALLELFPPALAAASIPAMLLCNVSLLEISRVLSSWIAVLRASCIDDSCSLRLSTLPSTVVDACASLECMPASTSSTRPPSTSDAFCMPALSSARTLLWSRASCSLRCC